MFGFIANVLYIGFGFLQLCSSSAVIEVRLVSFNSTGLLTSKVCCDSQTTGPCPLNECDPIFFICLQDFSGSGCSLGNVTTGYIPNTDAVVFSDVIGHVRTPNPCVFHVDNYPGVVIAKVTIFDEDILDGGQTNDKIDYLQYVYSFAPDKNGTTHTATTIPLTGAVSTLDIEFSVYCDQNYYGNKCDVLCIPDSLYYCDGTGQRLCRQGKLCTSTTIDPTASQITQSSSTSSLQTDSTTSSIAAITTTRLSSESSTYLSKTTSMGSSTFSSLLPYFSKLESSTDNLPQTQSSAALNTRTTIPDVQFVSSTTAYLTNDNNTLSTPRVSVTSISITSSSSRNVTDPSGCSYNISESDNGNFTLHMVGFEKDLKQMIESKMNAYLSKINHDTEIITNKQDEEKGETTYTIIMINKGDGLTLNTSIVDIILKELCIQDMTRKEFQVTKGDKSDNIEIIVPVIIIGLVVLLSIPMVYFICRRKCKNRRVGAEGEKDMTKTQGEGNLS